MKYHCKVAIDCLFRLAHPSLKTDWGVNISRTDGEEDDDDDKDDDHDDNQCADDDTRIKPMMAILRAADDDEDDTTDEPVGDGGGMEEGDGGEDPVAAGGADLIIRPGRLISHGEPGVWTVTENLSSSSGDLSVAFKDL